MRRLLACGLVSAVACTAAAPATAAQRYASPNGSGTQCSAENPCSLEQAVNNAVAGDEVIVNPGDYGTPASPRTTPLVVTADNVHVHGVDGQPRPRIVADPPEGPSPILDARALTFSSNGGTVRHLEIEVVARDRALHIRHGRGDDLVLRARGTVAGLNLTAACEPHLDAVLANSVCHTTNPDSQAVLTSAAYGGPNNVTLRNVTAVSQGPDSEGVYVQSLNFAGGSSAVTMINTIADGVQSDVFVAQDTQPASLTARYSNFETAGSSGGGTVNDDGTNQRSSPPLFANPATGDFHQAPSSPTIDAGVNEAENGPSDFDGDARVVNGRTDIGADEVVLPPSVTTGSATVDDTSATLTGVVNPNGAATTYRFEYGTDTSYGSSTPETSAGSSGDPQAVQATITGLQRGTTYHYRLVAANHLGTTTGADQTFSVAFLPGRCANLFNGTAGADVLTGTAFGDRISGLAGNDRLQGIGGGDCLFGGAGRDTLDGGVGRDTLRGGGARDKLNGGGSNDVLSGRSGNDVLSGGTGADRLSGGSGPDKLNGGAGPNRYSGGGGNDSIVAANGRVERVNCGSGHDKVRADARDRLRRCEDVRRLR